MQINWYEASLGVRRILQLLYRPLVGRSLTKRLWLLLPQFDGGCLLMAMSGSMAFAQTLGK